MKLKNTFGFMHLNSTPRITEQNDGTSFVKIVDLLTISKEDENAKFYLENTEKLSNSKSGNTFTIKSVNLWIFTKNIAYIIGCNLSSKNFSEIFIYYLSERRMKGPKKHFIEFTPTYVSMRDRSASLENNKLFYDEFLEALESKEAAPVMNFNEWKDFISPYDYYKKLKVELMAKNFYVTKLSEKNISHGKRYSSRTKSPESIATFTKPGELSKKIHIYDSQINNSEIVNFIKEINETSFYNDDEVFSQKERERFIKKSGNKLSMFSVDTMTAPVMVDTNLNKLTSYKNDKGFIGATSNITRKEHIINSSNTSLSKTNDKVNSESNKIKLSINNKEISKSNLGFILKDLKTSINVSNTNKSIYDNNFIKPEKLSHFKEENNLLIDSLKNKIKPVSEMITNIEKELANLNEEILNYNIKNNEFNNEINEQKDLLNNIKTVEKKLNNDISLNQKRNTEDKKRFNKNIEFINSINVTKIENEISKLENQKGNDKNSKNTINKQKLLLNKRELILDENKRISNSINELNVFIKKWEKEVINKNKEAIQILDNINDIDNNRKKNNQLFDSSYSKISQNFIKNILDKNIISILNELDELKDNFKKVNSFNLVEEKSVQEIIYYYRNKLSERDTYVYLIDRSSTILMDTIYKTIYKVQRDGMNNEIVKMIAQEKDEMPMNNGEMVESNYGGHLNKEQKDAYYKAINPANKLTVIQGPPGTGKTEIITELIRHFRSSDTKVILSSQTNEAISNVIEKLLKSDRGPIMTFWSTKKDNNIFSEKRISETWYDETFIKRRESIMKGFIDTSKKEFKFLKSIFKDLDKYKITENKDSYLDELPILNNSNVIGATTTTSSTNYGIGKDFVDKAKVLIIDEVSKSILIEILRYSIDVDKVILVGDYKQLSPMFDLRKDEVEDLDSFSDSEFDSIKEVIEKGVFYNVSKRANDANLNTQLVTNYRSIEEVLDSYKIFYGNDKLGKELIAHRKNENEFSETMKKYNFSKTSFFNNKSARYFVNIDNTTMLQNPKTRSRHNEGERKIIVSILKDLLNSETEITSKSLGVIFMYGEQLKKFKNENRDLINELSSIFKGGFRINTVDGYQGSESDIIIVATTFVGDPKEKSFLINYRRLNVALSRAKDILVMTGSEKYLSGVRMNRDGKEEDTYLKYVINNIKKSNKSKFVEGMVF